MKKLLKNLGLFVMWLLFITTVSATTRYKLSPTNIIYQGIKVTSGGTSTWQLIFSATSTSWVIVSSLTNSSWSLYVNRGSVSTWVAGGSSDTLLMSQKAVTTMVSNAVITNSGVAWANTYVQFNSGGWFGGSSYFTYDISNRSLTAWEITLTPGGDYPTATLRRFSGLQLNNILTIQTEVNGYLWAIQADGDITTTGTIKIGNTQDACDSTGAWIMKFSWDNFYWCKVASGRVLLN